MSKNEGQKPLKKGGNAIVATAITFAHVVLATFAIMLFTGHMEELVSFGWFCSLAFVLINGMMLIVSSPFTQDIHGRRWRARTICVIFVIWVIVCMTTYILLTLQHGSNIRFAFAICAVVLGYFTPRKFQRMLEPNQD